MSIGRWLGLVMAAIAAFFAAGIATILLLLASGQSLLGWHDNIGPEVSWGLVVGVGSALLVAMWLHGRWSAEAKGNAP